jgi:hypothetical protein
MSYVCEFITLEEPVRVIYRSSWRRTLDEFKPFARENVERFWKRISRGEMGPIPEVARLLSAEGNEVYRLELTDLLRPAA